MHVVTINAIKSSANCTSVPAGTAQKTTVTSIDDLKKQFPDQFDRVGSFEGKASLFLKRDARSSIDAPRNCSIHLKARLQQELDTMENDGIVRTKDGCSAITRRMALYESASTPSVSTTISSDVRIRYQR